MDEAGQEKGFERVGTRIFKLQCQQTLLHAIHTLHQRQLCIDGEGRGGERRGREGKGEEGEKRGGERRGGEERRRGGEGRGEEGEGGERMGRRGEGRGGRYVWTVHTS